MRLMIATGTKLKTAYGISRLPHVFLIGKDGKVLWEGGPADKDLDEHIKAAMK